MLLGFETREAVSSQMFVVDRWYGGNRAVEEAELSLVGGAGELICLCDYGGVHCSHGVFL